MNLMAVGYILGASIFTYSAWYFTKMLYALSETTKDDDVKDAKIQLAESLLVLLILVIGCGAAYGWIKAWNLLLRQGW